MHLHVASGMVDLDDLKFEDFNLSHMGHALSQLCRFRGGTVHFYSVAQHCVYVSMLVPPRLGFAALIHEGEEMFVTDVPTPIKYDPNMAWFRSLSQRITARMYECYSIVLTDEDKNTIKEADEIMLSTEAEQLLPKDKSLWHRKIARPAPFVITPLVPKSAERLWIARARELWTDARAFGVDADDR
ncbi:MAG TPA: hypothetical protein VNF68_11630 [Candidatus Baltobacteraceae bacterium]|nr:hypothetical protein [Candidatus Baltobacteraceae bacterium]